MDVKRLGLYLFVLWTLAKTCQGACPTYTVIAGDHLSDIATRFHTTVPALQQANSIADPNLITVGQVLTIPCASPPTTASQPSPALTSPASGACPTYTVVAGDGLSNIATRFGTTLPALQQANSITNPNNLAVGQVLTIPCVSPPTSASSLSPSAFSPALGACLTYTVVAGDRLIDIATRLGTTAGALQQANPSITDPNVLAVGQVLTIPPCTSAPAPGPLGCTEYYTVAAGETMTGVASKFDTSTSVLAALNPSMPNLNLVQAGQLVNVPCLLTGPAAAPFIKYNVPDIISPQAFTGDEDYLPAVPAPAPSGPCLPYTVKAGDSCWSLQTARLLSQQALQASNPSVDCNRLQVGQTLCLPSLAPSSSTCTRFVEAASGDSCWSLAVENRVQLSVFQQMNPHLGCSNLQVGSPVCVVDSQLAPAANATYICATTATTALADTCASLAAQYNTTTAQLQLWNGGLNCSPPTTVVNASLTICVAAVTAATSSDLNNLDHPNRASALVTVAQACASLDPVLASLTAAYTANPTPGNDLALRSELSAQLATPAGQTLIAQLEQSNATIRSYAAQLIPFGASNTCQQLQQSTDPAYAAARDCFCQNQPGTGVLHCVALLGEQLKTQMGSLPAPTAGTDSAGRRKMLASGSGSAAQLQALSPQLRALSPQLHGQTAWRRSLAQASPSAETSSPSSQCGTNSFKPPLNTDALGWLSDLDPTCQFIIPPVATDACKLAQGQNVPSKNLTKDIAAAAGAVCLGITCCADIEIINICVGANLCGPDILTGAVEGIKSLCTSNGCGHGNVLGVEKDEVQALLDDTYISADFTICLLKEFTNPIPTHPNICAHLLQLQYNWLKGMLQVSGGLDLWVATFSAGGNFKVTDAAGGAWSCNVPGMQCEDFCVMQTGQHYTTLSLKTTQMFGNYPIPLHCGEACEVPTCPKPADSPLSRLIGYTTDWAQYRNISDPTANPPISRPPSCKPYGQTPNHLDPSLYTHIIFAFAKVDDSNYTVVGVEDNDDMLIQQMTALKSGNSGLKCMISIGGWSFSRADEAFKGKGTEVIFPAVAASASLTKTFVTSAVNYAKSRGLDGIDLDWEYPNFLNNTPNERSNYTSLIQALRAATTAADLLFSIAVRPVQLDQHYEVAQLAPNTDFINLMSYDFHGGFDAGMPTGHNAPIMDCLNRSAGSTGPYWDIDYGVQTYLSQGVPADHINFGLATYGHAVTTSGSTSADPGPGAVNVTGNAAAGQCTYTPGTLAFYEIEALQGASAWARDTSAALGAWASYGGNNWVSFDDQTTHRLKMCYARANKLGGVFVWDTELDDQQLLIGSIKKQYDSASCDDYQPPVCGFANQ